MPDQLRYITDMKRHLVCLPYSIENLHRMAKELGIRRCWYHGGRHPHYDIPARRYDEITEQCEAMSSKHILIIIKEGTHK
ncbi:MAG TPA: DUF4031 domain-containing protein [Bacteroidia bacterium]|nr:DUF4031 domain-containing protein [Bacteroidia bacterium]